MQKIKCLVVDDEELARSLIKSYIEKVDFLELRGEIENPLDAIQILKQETIDLIFLDIQMPQLSGTELAKMIPDSTAIIFTTAYSEFALDGYELNALDYLLKPITFERFLKGVNKFQLEETEVGNKDKLTIKSGYDLYKIPFNTILYIESDSEYVNYYLESGKKIMSYQSLKKLIAILPPETFMRVHRSYIVNKNKVYALKGRDLVIKEKTIPVSSQYFDVVKDTLF